MVKREGGGLVQDHFLGRENTGDIHQFPQRSGPRANNLPEHYHGRSGREFDYIGEYLTCCFDLLGADKTRYPLMMTINGGSGDCNDGFWGCVYKSDSGNTVADIRSEGEFRSTIEYRENSLENYKKHENWYPLIYDSDSRGDFFYANDAQLEQIFHVILIIIYETYHGHCSEEEILSGEMKKLQCTVWKSNGELYTSNMPGIHLANRDLEGAELPEVNLEAAKFSRTDLLNANLERANLKGADLKDANLRGAVLPPLKAV